MKCVGKSNQKTLAELRWLECEGWDNICPKCKTYNIIYRALLQSVAFLIWNGLHFKEKQPQTNSEYLIQNEPIMLIIRENHHASVVWNCYHCVAIAYLYQPRCKIAIATKWYQFHTTDKCGFLFMPWITDQYTYVRYTKLVNEIGTAVAKVITLSIMTT